MNPHLDGRANRTTVNPNLRLGIGSDLVDHANRLGIKLRSAGRARHSPRGQDRQTTSARRANTAATEVRNWAVLNAWTTPSSQAYVQDVVFPLTVNTVADDENVRQSISRQSLSGSAKQTLPHMRSGSAHSQRSTSTYLDKYVSSTPNETSVLQESKASKKKIWNNSGQALRYQHEQEKKEKSRTLQRTAVVQPHRIDRMYYISGASFQMPGKYEVDFEEMDRLKDMARIRKEASHYGRGLSHEKKKLIGIAANDDIQVPLQPPNSHMENLPGLGPLSPSQSKAINGHHNPGPNGDHQNGLHKNEPNDVEGLSLKGVGFDGKRNSHSARVSVHVVNEDNTSTPHNSARTDKTTGHILDQTLINHTQSPIPPIEHSAESSPKTKAQITETENQVLKVDKISETLTNDDDTSEKPPSDNLKENEGDDDKTSTNENKEISDSQSEPIYKASEEKNGQEDELGSQKSELVENSDQSGDVVDAQESKVENKDQ